MTLIQKLAREQAKLYLKEYAEIHEWDEDKLKIFRSTSLFKFYLETIGGYKRTFTGFTSRVLFENELNLLRDTSTITFEEYKNLDSMLMSNHDGDLAIVEGAIGLLRLKRLRKSYKKKKDAQ